MLADVEAHHREIVVWFGTITEGLNSLLKRLYDLHSVFEVCFPKSFPIPLRNNFFKTYLFVLGQCYHKSAACGVGWVDGERAAQQL